MADERKEGTRSKRKRGSGKVRVMFFLDTFGIGGSERVISMMVNHIDRKVFEPLIGSFRMQGGAKLRNSEKVRHCHVEKDRVEDFLRKERIDAAVIMCNADEATVMRMKRHCKVLRIVNFAQLYSPVFDANLITTKVYHLKIRLLNAQKNHGGRGKPLRSRPGRNQKPKSLLDSIPELVNDYVLYHPVDFDRWQELKQRLNDEREQEGKQKGKIVIGGLARAEPSKWHYLFLGLLHEVKKQRAFSRFSFVLAGLPRIYKWYLKLFFRKELADRSITVLPPMRKDEDLARFYSSIDVFLQASWIGESFGCTITESFCFGKPVITDVKTFARRNGWVHPLLDDSQVELVDEGSDGFYANYPSQVYGFLASHPKKDLERMGRAGFQKVRRICSPQVIVGNLEKVLLGLLGGKGKQGKPIAIDPSRSEIRRYAYEYFRRTESVKKRESVIPWHRRVKYRLAERLWRLFEMSYLAARAILRKAGLRIEN